MNLSTVRKFAPKALLLAIAAPVMAAAVYLINGPTYGDWDLPGAATSGYAVGLLEDTMGNTVFKMKAKLVQTPSPSPAVQNGDMIGILSDGSGNAWPEYTVQGTWTGNSWSGTGTFGAYIYRQVSPLGPIGIVGKMAGKYSDSGWWTPIGAFKGEWKANL